MTLSSAQLIYLHNYDVMYSNLSYINNSPVTNLDSKKGIFFLKVFKRGTKSEEKET